MSVTVAPPTSAAPAERTIGETLLDVRNLRKFFPIRSGFLRGVTGQVRAFLRQARVRGHDHEGGVG